MAELDLDRLRAALATDSTPDWPVTTEWARETGLTFGVLGALVAEIVRLRAKPTCICDPDDEEACTRCWDQWPRPEGWCDCHQEP